MKNLPQNSNTNLPPLRGENSFIPSLCYKIVRPTSDPKDFSSLVWNSTHSLCYFKDKFTFPLRGTGIFCYENFPKYFENPNSLPVFLCQGFNEIKFSHQFKYPEILNHFSNQIFFFSDLELQEFWEIFIQTSVPQNVKIFSAIRPLRLIEN